MSSSYANAPAQFRVGSSIGKALGVFSKGWWKFFVLALIPLAPYYAYDLLSAPATLQDIARQQAAGGAYFWGLGLRMAVGTVLSALANATCLYGAYQLMRGRDFSIGDSLSNGLRRVASVAGTSVLTALAFIAGLALLLAPGFIVGAMFFVALPACVIEKLGPFASFGRSRALTKGSRWRLFGLILLTYLGLAVLAGAFGGIGAWVGGVVGYKLGAMPATVLFTAFVSVLTTVVYHDLRVAKEGVDIETLAGVFD